MSRWSADKDLTRRAFIVGSAFAGLTAFAGCEKLLGHASNKREPRPLKFLFMTDHHVESDFVQGYGLTKGEPNFTMWKPGNHAALVETYKFINEDSYCRDIDFALFGGDQINTGYDTNPQDMADEMENYFRTLDALDLHSRTKQAVADMDFVAMPWMCKQNLKKGMKPYYVEPKPLASRVVAIQGNHDTGVREFYRDCAFTAGDVRFIAFFASYVGLPPPPGKKFHSTAKIYDETIAFIEREMKAAASDPNIRHIVLCSHWAIAPAGKDFVCPILDACKENQMNDNRRRLLALCEKYGCDLYLNGHEHNGRYPVGRAGVLNDINCGTVSANPEIGQGAFTVVEIHPQKAVFNVYSRAAVREDGGVCTVTSIPKRLFTREIALAPIRPKV